MMRLTEEQYEMIRPLMPMQRGNVRLANVDVINAVLYVTENGCKWRLIRIRVECVGLDSTSVKVHPDGTGARKKWPAGHRQVARRLDHQDSSGCRE